MQGTQDYSHTSFLRFYEYISVDLGKHGGLTDVGDIPCCRNDCYYC